MYEKPHFYGLSLRAARREAQLTLRELAEVSGVSAGRLRDYENVKRDQARIPFCTLLLFLMIPSDWMMLWTQISPIGILRPRFFP